MGEGGGVSVKLRLADGIAFAPATLADGADLSWQVCAAPVTALDGLLEFPVCLFRGLDGLVEGNNGPDMVRETVKCVNECNHGFGLVSVSLPGGNTGLLHTPPCAQVIFIAAVHFVPLRRKEDFTPTYFC